MYNRSKSGAGVETNLSLKRDSMRAYGRVGSQYEGRRTVTRKVKASGD